MIICSEFLQKVLTKEWKYIKIKLVLKMNSSNIELTGVVYKWMKELLVF